MRFPPLTIKRREEGVSITWRDGHSAVYDFAYLRSRCPCAGCRRTPPKVVKADDPLKLLDDVPIHIDGAELVGNYAVQFFWNDGHSHGIYAFDYLRQICPCMECRSAG